MSLLNQEISPEETRDMAFIIIAILTACISEREERPDMTADEVIDLIATLAITSVGELNVTNPAMWHQTMQAIRDKTPETMEFLAEFAKREIVRIQELKKKEHV